MRNVQELFDLAKEVNTKDGGLSLKALPDGGLEIHRAGNKTFPVDSANIAFEALTHYKEFLSACDKIEPIQEHFFILPESFSVENGTITKISPTEWGSGTFSIEGFEGDGYVSANINRTDKILVFGLSTVERGGSYDNIDYHLYATTRGLEAREGAFRKIGDLTYTEGSLLELERVDGEIKYYVDNQLVYTSPKHCTGKMFIDTAFQTQGGQLSNLKVHHQPKVREV